LPTKHFGGKILQNFLNLPLISFVFHSHTETIKETGKSVTRYFIREKNNFRSEMEWGGGDLLQLGAGWGSFYSVSPFLPATLLKSFMFVVTIGVPANINTAN
jgi:hypothetical protein